MSGVFLFKKRIYLLLVVFLVLFQIQGSPGLVEKDQIQSTQNIQVEKKPVENITNKLQLSQNYGKIPLYFIPNKGQVDDQALFYANTSRYTLWITNQGLVFDSFKRAEGNRKIWSKKDRLPSFESGEQVSPPKFERDVSRLIFLNANRSPKISALETTEHKVNYFKGNDKSKWQTGISSSLSVLYKELYKNIDLKVYGKENQIEYDFIVKPGGQISDIQFEYRDVEKISIDKDGNLVIRTRFGELTHKKPFGYQEIDGQLVDVVAHFKEIKSNTYSFEVAEYNKNYDLIIDPLILVYSTYLGGSGTDQCYDIAVDPDGAAYVTGYTSSLDFPTQAPIYGTIAGDFDAFVAKINPEGDGLVYSTYLGGLDTDIGVAIALKPYDAQTSSKNITDLQQYDTGYAAYVTGYTFSTDFPTESPTQASSGGWWDAFVTIINAAGTALDFSTYIGGWSTDAGNDIDVDSEGNAHIAGITISDDFPTTNPLVAGFSGGWDCFYTKINLGNSIGSGLRIFNNGNEPETETQTKLPSDDHDNNPLLAVISPDLTIGEDVGTLFFAFEADGTNFHTEDDTTIVDLTQDGDTSFIDLAQLAQDLRDAEDRVKGRVRLREVVHFSNRLSITTTALEAHLDPPDDTLNEPILAFSYLEGMTGNQLLRIYNTFVENPNFSSLSLEVPLIGNEDVFDVVSLKDILKGYECSCTFCAGVGDDPDHPGENDDTVTFEVNGQPNSENFIRAATSNSAEIKRYHLGGSGVDIAWSVAGGNDGGVYIAGATNSSDFPTLSFQDNYGGNIDGIVAKYRLAFALTINVTTGGTTDPVPGTSNQFYGTEVSVTAIPETGNVFWKWTGDASGSENPVSVTVIGDKSITANFVKISPPLDFAGQKVLNRSLFRAEYINNLTWTANPANQNIDKYRIYLIDGDTQSLVVELNAGTTSYMIRNVEESKVYTYAIQAVNSDGVASALAYATVQ